MTDTLRERVARALYDVERGGCWDDEDEYHKQDFYNMAEPVIALIRAEVLEEAARCAEDCSVALNGTYEAIHIAAAIRALKEEK